MSEAGGSNRISGRTLEFAVPALDLLVVSLLYVALENACSCWLVKTGGFQDVCGIDPVVGLASHHMLFLPLWADELELPYWILIVFHVKSVNREGEGSMK